MHYPYLSSIKNDFYSYSFYSFAGAVYVISIRASSFGHNIYEISIYNDSSFSKNLSYDEILQPTIVAILKDFFGQRPNVAIGYTCYNSDSFARGAARARLFQQWFEASNVGDYTHIKDFVTNKELQCTYYNGIIIANKNPNKEDLIATFHFINEEMSK